MATCPNCRTSSRTDPDAFSVEEVVQAKPIGSFSLAGAQLKLSGVMRLRLRCRCGWSILGVLKGDAFEGDPDTQTWPSPGEGQ